MSDLRAIIPRYFSNEAFLALYDFLRKGELPDKNDPMYPIVKALQDEFGNTLTEEEIKNHYEANKELLKDPNVYRQGDFIENQNQWQDIMYGKDTNYPGVENFANTSNMMQSGCEVIAVANALHNMGYDLTPEEMANLIRNFEKDGIVMNGVIGTSPMALYEYMADQGFSTDYITSNDPVAIDNFSQEYDTFIVTAYNDKNDVSAAVHTVCITKNNDGTYVVHNGYNTDPNDSSKYVGSASYKSLEEAMKHVVPNGDPESIMITGVGEEVSASASDGLVNANEL